MTGKKSDVLCKHGVALCEKCAFERGRNQAISEVEKKVEEQVGALLCYGTKLGNLTDKEREMFVKIFKVLIIQPIKEGVKNVRGNGNDRNKNEKNPRQKVLVYTFR